MKRFIIDNAIKTVAWFLRKNPVVQQITKRVLLENNIIESLMEDSRIRARFEFSELWEKLRTVVQADRIHIIEKDQIYKINSIKDYLLNIICEDDKAFLANGVMKFPDRHSLWVLINEILINEDYYFETDTETPRILDCGTHFGMAIYYFKNIYPKAEITGFEPIPWIRELAIQNVKMNHYQNVNITPFALSHIEGERTFYVSKTFSMAGSLTDRRCKFGDDVVEIKVKCRKLSDYLTKPVHFLKIDIEGVEDTVLLESEDFLSNVEYLFCEYHHGVGLAHDRLGKILHVLEKAGFNVETYTASQRAMERLEEKRFHVLITDVRMSGPDGIDVLSFVKKRGFDTQVIVITGYGSIETVLDSKYLGAFKYVQKPFKMEDLCKEVIKASKKVD